MSHSFYSLTPDLVLDSVEQSLSDDLKGRRLTGRAQALNSIENRVYEIEIDSDPAQFSAASAHSDSKVDLGSFTSIVAKFYRPRRWSAEQILEEHEFIADLVKAEIPVTQPMPLEGALKVESRFFPGSSTLGQLPNGIYFSLFRKIRARSFDELSDEKLLMVGRFLARLHVVGSNRGFQFRKKLTVESYGFEALDRIREARFLEEPIGHRYENIAGALLEKISRCFEGMPCQRVHGDCHLGNLLWVQDAPIFVDFDDSLLGPPVQDLWMIAHNRSEQSRALLERVLEGYEEFREFPRETLVLMEPLRALRLIHYSGWIASRWDDPSFAKMFPHFGGEKWWQEEIESLLQIDHILDYGN